jgi:hypothetical protein
LPSPGTVKIKKVRFQLPARLRFVESLYVRYQSWDLSQAYVVDERTDELLARIYPLDKARNADRRRRPLEPCDGPSLAWPPVEAGPVAPLLRQYLAEYAATGLPPAYLPKDEILNETENTQEPDHGQA